MGLPLTHKSFTLRRFLTQSQARPVPVPHRQNRVVIFNSDLIHETAPLKIRDGYENRRVNITMLYGNGAPETRPRAAPEPFGAGDSMRYPRVPREGGG